MAEAPPVSPSCSLLAGTADCALVITSSSYLTLLCFFGPFSFSSSSYKAYDRPSHIHTTVNHRVGSRGCSVPDLPGTSLAHLVRRVFSSLAVCCFILYCVCDCGFLRLLLFLPCVLYCTAVYYCIGLCYPCIVVSHCTCIFFAHSVCLSVCLLHCASCQACIGALPCPSPRLALRLANRTSSLGIIPAITRCCAHLYVIATGIHPAPSAQPSIPG